jgi:enterochelin esterase family protein
MGTQDPPGTAGDGRFQQPGPYNLPPEALSHLNGAPTGQVLGPMVHTLTGTYMGWTPGWKFTYWVYVPAQYKPGHAAAFMMFQDGSLYIGNPNLSKAQFNAPTVFDNLIAEGSMPVTIGVFVDPGSSMGQHVGGGDGGRSRQYDTANDQFGKFLLTEFIPTEIAGKYDLVTDADGWGIGGHSSGGIAAIMAAWYYPDKFHKAITASPSFPNTGGAFPKAILGVSPAKPLRVYHLSGTADLPGWFAANNQAQMDFAMMGYHYRYRPGTGAHFPPAAAAADFPDALRWLWRGYHAPP